MPHKPKSIKDLDDFEEAALIRLVAQPGPNPQAMAILRVYFDGLEGFNLTNIETLKGLGENKLIEVNLTETGHKLLSAVQWLWPDAEKKVRQESLKRRERENAKQ